MRALPTTRPAGTKSAHPTLREFASLWLKRRIADGIAEKTEQDYLWQLGTRILPQPRRLPAQ